MIVELAEDRRDLYRAYPHRVGAARVEMEAVLGRLAGHGISFPVTVCGNDVAATKPDPEPYLTAAALLGADPRWCAVLEDSPAGVAAARAAGCAVVAVPSLAPIPDHLGLLVAGALTDIDLATLRSLVSAGAPGVDPATKASFRLSAR